MSIDEQFTRHGTKHPVVKHNQQNVGGHRHETNSQVSDSESRCKLRVLMQTLSVVGVVEVLLFGSRVSRYSYGTSIHGNETNHQVSDSEVQYEDVDSLLTQLSSTNDGDDDYCVA